jgi:hypothetical protein
VRRFLLHLLLLVSLALPGLGWAAQRDPGAGQEGHDSLHWQEVAHHHQDDGGEGASVVVDDSAKSISHVAADGTSSSPAMPAVAMALAALAPSRSPPHWQQPVPQSPDLEGPQRPPRQRL